LLNEDQNANEKKGEPCFGKLVIFVVQLQFFQKSDLHSSGWKHRLSVSESLDIAISMSVSDGWCKYVGLSQLEVKPWN